MFLQWMYTDFKCDRWIDRSKSYPSPLMTNCPWKPDIQLEQSYGNESCNFYFKSFRPRNGSRIYWYGARGRWVGLI